MGEDGKKYVVYGMRAECTEGSMKNYISTDVGHGVVYQGQPLLNANDHTPQVNLTHFGDCHSKLIYEQAKKAADEKYKADADDGFFTKVGKFFAKTATKAVLTAKEYLGANKCELDTPLPWMFVNKEHMIDGAPALTIESQCACRYGGIIKIVLEEEETKEVETEENAAEETAEQEEFLQMMQESYGFSDEQASLIAKAYDAFMADEKNQNLSREEQLHALFSNMAGLCINYSGEAVRWNLVCDTPSTLEAMKYFEKLGLNEQEVFDLMGAINFQHTEGVLLSNASDYNSQGFCSDANCNRQCGYQYHITDSPYQGFDYGSGGATRDFAHELIQYACFSNGDSFFHKTWNFFEPVLGDIKSMTGYKGDVYSTRMGKDDMNSDIDAVNLYHLFLDKEENVLKTMTDYNKGVASGNVNRAEEFLKNLGEGDAQKGYQALENELNQAEYGAIYIDRGVKGIIQDALYTDAVVSSGVASLGEETFEEVMEHSTKNQVEVDKKISNKRQEFLNYVYDTWKTGEEK